MNADVHLIRVAPYLSPEEEAGLLDRIQPPIDLDNFNPNECWLRHDDSDRYTAIYGYGHYTPAHRVSYQHFWGYIPKGFVVNHICETKACINPDHLEAVTQAENCRYSAYRRLGVSQPSRIPPPVATVEDPILAKWRAKKAAAIERARALPELTDDYIPPNELIPYSQPKPSGG